MWHRLALDALSVICALERARAHKMHTFGGCSSLTFQVSLPSTPTPTPAARAKQRNLMFGPIRQITIPSYGLARIRMVEMPSFMLATHPLTHRKKQLPKAC